MLESSAERLMETVHAGSPTKHPARRLATIEAAGELHIPFTSGILVGIGETEEERVASLEAIAASHDRHGHIQEVIIQNFVPHPRYYGAEVADIADQATRERWKDGDHPTAGIPASADAGSRREPGAGQLFRRAERRRSWASEVSLDELKRLISECRRLMPEVGIQVPPNLSEWWVELVEAGATDLGGLSANGDHISPEHAFPSPHELRKSLAPAGFALTERLCVYPQYMETEWMEQGVLDVIKLKYWSFIPRRGSGRRRENGVDPGLAPTAIAKGRDGAPLSEDELTALFAEVRPEVIEEMRLAADELRSELAGERATFVVNRNINFTNVCVVGCAFCGFGQGRRSPDAFLLDEEKFAERVREAVELRRDRDLHAGRHPPRLRPRGLRPLAAARQAGGALASTSTPTRRWRCTTCASAPASQPRAVFEYLRECGLGSTPGTAAEVLDDGVRQRISPNKLPVDRWVEIIEASHASGLRSTSTVMFGHIEEPRELARHMRVVARFRSAPAASPSSSRSASSPSTRCSAAPTGSRRSAPRRTSSTPPPSASASAGRSPTCRRAG